MLKVARGDLLVATPKLDTVPWHKSVILVTESNDRTVMGTILNRPSTMTTEEVTECAVPRTLIHMGGPLSTQALFMLHTSEFQSSNTLDITNSWSVSSDELMFDKLAFGQLPVWYRFYMGAAGWHPEQLKMEIQQDSWLTIHQPSFELVTEDPETQWQTCVDSVSQKMFSEYL